MAMIAAATLAGAAFVSTNVDDLALLLGMVSRRDQQTTTIVAGQLLATMMLLAASVAVASLALVVPRSALQVLGLLPLAIGAWALWKGPESIGRKAETEGGRGRGLVTVAALTIANGSDNIAATVPLVAGRGSAEIAVVGVVYAVMTVMWFGLAIALVAHPRIGGPARRWSGATYPYALMTLGVMILVSR